MHYYEVAPSQIIRAGSTTFTYASPLPLRVGQIVSIEVGKKHCIGIIMRATKKPTYATKQVSAVIEDQPLPLPLLQLAEWITEYYATPLAIVLQAILPRGAQKARRERSTPAKTSLRDRTKIVLNKDQLRAIETIDARPTGTSLLHGVTGAGKTAVYIELSRRALERSRSVILLVPEIALTSQLVDEFRAAFSDKEILLAHSRQTEAERHTIWKRALVSQRPILAIGPRSALFLPIPAVGLIVVDEAHEPSYKQDQSPRYSALRAATVLARHHNAKVVLGSATPSITDYYLAEQSQYPIVSLATRAREAAIEPTITLVDMTKRTQFKKHPFLSDILLRQLSEAASSGAQSLIFHNRRGSASTTLCENCGWHAMCPTCHIPLTLHADEHKLQCHTCGRAASIPTHCPVCNTPDIIFKGIGTKRIESELRKLFPTQTIARFDGDSQKGESVEEKYKELYDGSIDIIIGTQVIAKGLDLPKLRTVGVLQADAGLSLPDYTSSERTFQLLTQVIGRVGRSHHATSVVVQTYQPKHPAITYGIAQNYAAFYQHEITMRAASHFPPFCYLLKLTCIYKTEAATIKNAQKVAQLLRLSLKDTDIHITPPTPSFYERQHDTYRWQIILKSQRRTALLEALRYVPTTHWQFEIDPVSLL
jgi:primosomal protein N' (replication factor Y)